MFLLHRAFVRALFTVQVLDDTKQASTISNEVITEKVIPLIDLIPRPVLKVTRVGLQMVILFFIRTIFLYKPNDTF